MYRPGLGEITDVMGLPLAPTATSPGLPGSIWSGFQVPAVASGFSLTSFLQRYSTYIYVGAGTLLVLALFGGRRR